jgi:hypothetical protein
MPSEAPAPFPSTLVPFEIAAWSLLERTTLFGLYVGVDQEEITNAGSVHSASAGQKPLLRLG